MDSPMHVDENYEGPNEWHADYFECEPAPDNTNNPWFYGDTNFPAWSKQHLEQLEHFWSLCREYCRANHLPLLNDNVSFAAFCRALSPLNDSFRRSVNQRAMVTAAVRRP